MLWKSIRSLISSKWTSMVVKIGVSFLSHWVCDQKGLIFSLKNQSKFCPQLQPWQIFIWPVLDNHCWPRFDSQDWFSGSPTDFSSGCFCWTRDQKILSRELKNSRIFLNLLSFEKRGQQILAKVGRINITQKYPVKIRLCLKRWILKKYWPQHYNLLFKPF